GDGQLQLDGRRIRIWQRGEAASAGICIYREQLLCHGDQERLCAAQSIRFPSFHSNGRQRGLACLSNTIEFTYFEPQRRKGPQYVFSQPCKSYVHPCCCTVHVAA